MPMTTVSNLSGESSRTFEIEVIGSPHQVRLRTISYKVLVPFSSLSQTIRSIGQRGGKVAKVRMLTTSSSDFEDNPTDSGILVPLEAEAEAPPQPSIAATQNNHNPPSKSHRHHSKSKKR
jgi:CpcD/allophycocyanin linker domain